MAASAPSAYRPYSPRFNVAPCTWGEIMPLEIDRESRRDMGYYDKYPMAFFLIKIRGHRLYYHNKHSPRRLWGLPTAVGSIDPPCFNVSLLAVLRANVLGL